METLLGQALSDLAKLSVRKWYALMAIAGMFVAIWAALFGTPHDDLAVGSGGAFFMFLGFTVAECRQYIRDAIPVGGGFTWYQNKYTMRWTRSGIALCLAAIASGAVCALRLLGMV